MYSQIAANKRRTVFLIIAFIILLTGLGWVFANIQGTPVITIVVFIGALIYALVGYFASRKIALALTGAKPIEKKQAPELYRTVENLTITAGMPMPDIYIIDDQAPNAFATGRNPQNAVVGVTRGLLETLDDEELEGVIAHELSHIQNYDIRVMSVVLVLVTITALVSDILLRFTIWGDSDNRHPLMLVVGIAAALIAPLAAVLLKMAVSRKREFLADASGSLLTRYPDGLAQALRKIENSAQSMRRARGSTAHLFISNPLKQGKKKQFFSNLFSTHPPTEERVERLQKMGREL